MVGNDDCGAWLSVQVSSKIVGLDEDAKELRVRNADLEVETERLTTSNHQLAIEKTNLQGDIQDKIQLLQDFEIRFERQFK